MEDFTIEFLTRFCKETGKDMKYRVITGYSTKNDINGVIFINCNCLDGSINPNPLRVNMVELMSFLYVKITSNNF